MRTMLFVCAIAIAGCGNMAGGGDGGNGGDGSGGSAGGGGGAAAPDYTSGSRIKARVISSADGAKAFAGFYDTTLATACAFSHAADDSLRCLPTNAAISTKTWWGDSGCTMPLAQVALGCGVAYATEFETTSSCIDNGYNSGSVRTHVFAIGGMYTGASVWVGSPGSCTMTTPPAAYTLFTVGSEVPASNFAAGSIDIAP